MKLLHSFRTQILVSLSLTFGGVIASSASQTHFFEPYKQSSLRLPAVPLLVNDPYFSVWSPHDRLTDGGTRHWTDAAKPLLGLLKVDNAVYCFMGNESRQVLETILPMGDQEPWTAPCLRITPTKEWNQVGYNDDAWPKVQGALGNDVKKDVHTLWSGDSTDVYIRRTFRLTADDLKKDFAIRYSHDDVCELFINGVKIHDTGLTWKRKQQLTLNKQQLELLQEGENVLAMHCHNTTGGAYADMGFYALTNVKSTSILTARQKSVSVMATNTYYTFSCGPIDLDVVFTSPMLMDDYDLLSTPINYISYQVRSTDGKDHSVKLYLATTPEMAINNVNHTITTTISTLCSTGDGNNYVRCGTSLQPILKRQGDGVCIDWGYFYLSDHDGKVALAPLHRSIQSFINTGHLVSTSDSICSQSVADMPALSYMHNFEEVGTQPVQGFTMAGYDEIKDIEYLGKQYTGYWAHNGKVTIFEAFNRMARDYTDIMNRCRHLDKTIYDDGMTAGGIKYAEMLSGHYRLVMAAHKLFQDEDGHLLFFSKENNSNGSVNTVDLTYPEAPLYLSYRPELQKAMMTSIFEYSKSGRWTKPFAAHDMGTYPIANGQTYNGDMPVEECGNMLTLAATLCMLDGNTSYIDPYWDILTLWNDYLVKYGQDPENQLCTDDFAGHWAHNCNLSAKAIMGIKGYSIIAEMKGLKEEAKRYDRLARKMAKWWEKEAREDDHYRLAFDRDSTWSQKYNLIWDKIWKSNVFSPQVMSKEIAYYLKHQNIYGLPLDCRKDYTKSDWILWTATMADKPEDFSALLSPVYKYIHETPSRVPTSDWHDTKTGRYQAFIARSVLGGYWMKVFMDKFHSQVLSKKRK